MAGAIPTSETVRSYLADNPATVNGEAVREARNLSRRYRFFHWPLEFPEVFARGGFDCVLGNPPWDTIKENSDEFFSHYDSGYKRQNSKWKKNRIIELCQDHDIAIKWLNYQKLFNSVTKYFKGSPFYHHQGTGHLNAFKLFTERYFQLIANTRFLGIIVPSSIQNDEGCTELRKLLIDKSRIQSLLSFENKNKIFPIHSGYKFVLFITQRGGKTDILNAGFKLLEITNISQLKLEYLKIPVGLIKRFSPDTLSIMEFPNQYEIDLMKKIYSNFPLLGEKVQESWNAVFHRELNLTDDDSILQTIQTDIPVYEGKMIHHYNHEYELPQYWLLNQDAKDFYSRRNYSAWNFCRLAYRAVASSTNETTLICTIIPKHSGSVNSLRVIEIFSYDKEIKKIILSITNSEQTFLTAMMNSLVLNYIIRRKVSENISAFYVYQLPIPRLKSGSWYFEQIVPRAARLIATDDIYAEFWGDVYQPSWNQLSTVRGGTSSLMDWDKLSKAWNTPCGVYGWDERKRDANDRLQLRCELDALIAHLYRLNNTELEYILSTFPALKENMPGFIEGVLKEFEKIDSISKKPIDVHEL